MKESGPIPCGCAGKRTRTNNEKKKLQISAPFWEALLHSHKILKWIHLPDEKVGISCPKNMKIGLRTL